MQFIRTIRQDIISNAASFYLSGFRARIKNETAAWFVRRYPACANIVNFNEEIADLLTQHFAEHLVEHPEHFVMRLTYYGGGRFHQGSQKKQSYPFIDTLLSLKAIEANPNKYSLHFIDERRFIDSAALERYGELLPACVVHNIKFLRSKLKDHTQYSEGDVALAMLNTFDPLKMTFHSNWLEELENRDDSKQAQHDKFYAEFEKILSPKGLNLAYRKTPFDWNEERPLRLTHTLWRHALQDFIHALFSELGYHTPKAAIEDYIFIEREALRAATQDSTDLFSVNASVPKRIQLMRDKANTLVGTGQLGRLKKIVPVSAKKILTAMASGLRAQRSDTLKTTGYYTQHASYATPIMKRIKRILPKPLHECMQKLCYIEWEAGHRRDSTVLSFAQTLKKLDIDLAGLDGAFDRLLQYGFNPDTCKETSERNYTTLILGGAEGFVQSLQAEHAALTPAQKQAVLIRFLTQLPQFIDNDDPLSATLTPVLNKHEVFTAVIALHQALALYQETGDTQPWAALMDNHLGHGKQTATTPLGIAEKRKQASFAPFIMRTLLPFISDNDLMPLFTHTARRLSTLKSAFQAGQFEVFVRISSVYLRYMAHGADAYIKALIEHKLYSEHMFGDNALYNPLFSAAVNSLNELPRSQQQYFATILTGFYEKGGTIPETITRLLPKPHDEMAPTLTEEDAPYALPYIQAHLEAKQISPIDYLGECPSWQKSLVMSLLSRAA